MTETSLEFDLLSYQKFPSIAARNAIALRFDFVARSCARKLAQDDWLKFHDDFVQVGRIKILKVLEKIAGGFMPHSPIAYFYLQVKGSIRVWMRSQYRRFYRPGGQPTLLVPASPDETGWTFDDLLPVAPVEDDDAPLVYLSIARLDERYRQVIKLTFIDGLGRAEIADRLGVCRDTIRRRLAEAIAVLQREFGVTPTDTGKVLKGIGNRGTQTQSNRDRAAHWLLTDPTGKQWKIKNLQQFCLNANLQSAKLSQVASGKRSHHQGWKCQKL